MSSYSLDGSGEYVYTGKYYVFTADDAVLRRAKRAALMLSILSAAALLVTGLFNFEGSRIFYVIIPYVFMFLPAYLTLSSAMRLMGISDKLTDKQANILVFRLKHASFSLVLLSCISLFGEICFMLWGACADASGEIAFLAGCAIVSMLNYVLFYISRRYLCIKISN